MTKPLLRLVSLLLAGTLVACTGADSETTDAGQPIDATDGSVPETSEASTSTTEDRPATTRRRGTSTKPSTSATASTASSTADSTTSSTLGSTASTTDSSAAGSSAGEGSTTSSTTVSSSVATITPSTVGSGLGAVTTVAGGTTTDGGIYQGILGKLSRDEQVVSAAGPQPTAASGVMPLTGQSGNVPNRPAAVVKIDNGGPARPQTGLNAADIVIEEEVEGGITRFAAIFHSQSTIVGPVRSARTTDIGIINGFGSPLLMYSGANEVTDNLIRSQPTVQNRNAGTSSGYWRSSNRRAPSNLYTDTAPHWSSSSSGPPKPQFHYRSGDEAVAGGQEGVEDTDFSVHYRANTAGWTWVGSHYVRTQGGSAHMTAAAGQVASTNVVVIEAKEVATGMVDSSGATVPEFVFVGSGKATAFVGGRRYEGTWTRPRLADAAVLTTADGSLIKLNPGRTWIELIEAGSGALK